MLSTHDVPYKLNGGEIISVACDDIFKLRCHRFQLKAILPWSETVDCIYEVDNVFTIEESDKSNKLHNLKHMWPME